VERGTYEELLAKGGVFAELHAIQTNETGRTSGADRHDVVPARS
jgi:hypothetical protein